MDNNKPLDLNTASLEDLQNTWYWSMKYEKTGEVDYVISPLVLLESFTQPLIELRVGKDNEWLVSVPLEWNIVVTDSETADVEIIPIKQLNDRGFCAFCYNPQSGYIANFMELNTYNIFPDYRWLTPKVHQRHLLAVPLYPSYPSKHTLEKMKKPLCVYITPEADKLPKFIDYNELV